MISVAVDFAKHGKCVDPDKFQHIEKRLTQWPDYFEQSHKGLPIHKSEHIIGKLYREVNCKELYKLCLYGDHEKSIAL